jgi:uncharacterized lipoprotein YddW (UPF0748 family)
MKRIVIAVIFICCIMIYPQQLKELRGVWITNVNSTVLSSDDGIKTAVDYLASIGVNVIFPVMWNGGNTLYPSKVMYNLFGKSIASTMSGRDPLQRLITEAHRNGIEVIPWLEYGFASSYVYSGVVSGDAILTKYPAWASKTNTGNYCIDGDGSTGFVWMSGINPDVQNFMISLVTEILDNYDVDGIQGDDRLPALPAEGGYDSVTVAIYKAEHSGTAPTYNYQEADWKRWRADKLTAFLSRLKDSIKVRGTNLILSSAPSPYYWGYDDHLQDSKSWVNNGIVENFIPQIYPDAPARSFATYQYILQKTLADISTDKKSIMFPGVLAEVGSYVIPSSQLVNCVLENRNNGLSGETYFFYEGIANANKNNGDTLRSTVYTENAALPYRNGFLWRPKPAIVDEDDTIRVTSTGTWKLAKSTALGFHANMYYTNDTAYTSRTYSADVPADGWYGIYTWIEANNLYSTNARYVIYTGADSVVCYVDQTLQKNKGFYKLQDVYLTKGYGKILKVDNTGLASGRYLMSDAMMMMINRKLSPETIISSIKESNDNENSSKPHGFMLYDNFPNPFNPSTKISYAINHAANVSLKVYSVLGKEVAALWSGYQQAGNYQLTFNSTKLQSGVYFYRLQVDDASQTKKMIVLK